MELNVIRKLTDNRISDFNQHIQVHKKNSSIYAKTQQHSSHTKYSEAKSDLSILEKMLEISGSEHKYQYLILLLTFMIWINLNLLTLIIPYLEKQPEVSYILYVSNVVVFFSINT